MLSCRRRASLPAPGRHKGRIPEWDTDTRTDIRTVLQQTSGPGPLQVACSWDEAVTEAGGAKLPELSAMSQTPRQVEGGSLLLPATAVVSIRSATVERKCICSRSGYSCCLALNVPTFLSELSGRGTKENKTGSTGSRRTRLLFTSGEKLRREESGRPRHFASRFRHKIKLNKIKLVSYSCRLIPIYFILVL